MPQNILNLVARAREFQNHRAKPKGKIPLDPLIANSPSIKKAIAGMMAKFGCTRAEAEDAIMREQNFHELLTHEELAARLKVKTSWIHEKTRKRCQNPIPSIPMGRYVRFDWDAIVKWLEEQAQARSAK